MKKRLSAISIAVISIASSNAHADNFAFGSETPTTTVTIGGAAAAPAATTGGGVPATAGSDGTSQNQAYGLISSAKGGAALSIGDTVQAAGRNATSVGSNSNAVGNNSVSFGGAANSTGVGSSAIGASATATANNSVALGAASVADRVNSVSVGSVGSERQVTNVAAGGLSATSTDAVNGSQLYSTAQSVTNLSNQVSQLGNQSTQMTAAVTAEATRATNAEAALQSQMANNNSWMTRAQNGSIGAGANATGKNATAIGNATASGNNSVAIGQGSVADRANSFSVGAKGSERQVTNVAAGTAATDAVNVQQLNNGISQATQASQNYTDARVGQLQNSLDSMKSDMYGGVAAALAVAGLPQPTAPGRSMVSAATSNYHGQQGFAAGYSYVTQNNKWVVKASATSSTRGDFGGVVGAGYQF
ncbi:YadA family autotransporter adhesin [Trinickia fusca]|uniref:Adhesin n=1 Tax=Trinickia fusca TaxID=2419777 RepID=A0A494X6J7_9BURK|nr:hypothetical protein D7S89_20735 [Trinickia fusca]